MSDTTKAPGKNLEASQESSNKLATQQAGWHPFETLRNEIDRLFEDFDHGLWRSPFARGAFDIEPPWRRELSTAKLPAVDIVERDQQYEINAELPGLDEKNITITLADGMLTLRGEKAEQKEERKRNHFLSERHYGSFQRTFRVPPGVDIDKIDAAFSKGVLTVKLPKTAEAQRTEKKIPVKAA